jgi:hypothetical protein
LDEIKAARRLIYVYAPFDDSSFSLGSLRQFPLNEKNAQQAFVRKKISEKTVIACRRGTLDKMYLQHSTLISMNVKTGKVTI